MAKKKKSAKKKGVKKASAKPAAKVMKAKKPDMGIAIAALVVNLFIPGVGSMIGGRIKTGVWQLVLAIVGAVLSVILIGIPIAIAAWIWALVTGIQLIQEASK